MKANLQLNWGLWQRKTLLLFFFSMVLGTGLIAQRTITGVVSDDTGETLIGATVLVKGTSSGTVTDIDGKFSVEAPKDATSLMISYTGYASQEVPLTAENNYTVTLSAGVLIDEVVVTGYSTQSKRNITGAVASVEVAEIQDLPVNSVEQALQGRVAGVNVTSSGAPGSGANIRIRGYGTINNNDPLYVIDGVPVQRGLNEINPNDIKSIQVLKDASAASIYGARASNGVIIITTKNGSVGGKSTITVDATYGIQNHAALPELMNSQELADYIFQLQTNAGQDFSHGQYGSGSSPVLPEYINGDPTQPYDPVTNAVTRAAPGEGTDWLDEIFDAAPIYNINVGASGGNEAGQYALSAGYLNQEGTIIHTGYKRYTLRANTLFRAGDRLRVGENFTVAYGDRVDLPGGVRGTGNAVSMAFRSPSIIPVFDEAGNFAGSKGGELTNADNPVAQLFRNRENNTTNLRAFGNVFAELDIMDGLTAKTSFNVDYNNYRFKGFVYPNPESIEGDPNRNILNQGTGNNTNWTWYNTLNYSKTFGDRHNVNVLVGTEAINNSYEQTDISNSGFATFDPSYWYLSVATGAPIVTGAFGVQSSIFSVFGKVDYDLDGKYLVSATLRRDGSSRFGPENRYAVFPAFNVGWRLSDEGFMDGVSLFRDLKLRVGWGKTGNQEIGDYRFVGQYAFSNSGTTYDINGTGNSVAAGFAQSVNANPDIKWEETTSLNIGFDADLSNGFYLNFDWYNRLTTDMLVQVPAPSTGPIAADPFRNIGDVSNTGIDLVLGYDKTVNKDFSYGVNVNFGTYTNEVTNLGGENVNFNSGAVREFTASRIQEGLPIAYFYGYEIDGLDESGRFNFVDTDGDGEITGEDRTYLGDPHPDFTYGININLNYKAFDLNIFANGVQGNELFNANKYFTHFNSFQGNRSTDIINESFGYPGVDNSSATLPQVNLNAPALEFNSTSYFVEDGSYFRLRNIQLGYNIANDKLAKVGMSGLKLFVQATNLFTITKYTGLDPEIGRSTFYEGFGQDWGIGIDSGFYPVTTTYTFGVRASF